MMHLQFFVSIINSQSIEHQLGSGVKMDQAASDSLFVYEP